MKLTNDFRVALPVERAWRVLTDLERIAPCMPGAQLQEVEGDEYRGIVKIKVGPITAQYKGQATFLERDDAGCVAVLKAEGRETRGQGNASAVITATLVADGDGTAVSLVTDLTITGKVAQFGRGVLADVSAKLLDQFVESLEATVLADEPEAEPASTPTEPAAAAATDRSDPVRPEVRRIDAPEPAPVDLLGTAGSPVAKRVGPIVAIVAILWLLRRLLRRSRR